MEDPTKLTLIRTVHTIIYLVMASSVLLIFVSGIVRYRGIWLTASLVLISIESVVFLGNRMRCPLTALAQRYGATKGYAFDTFLPEKATRHTFWFFGGLLLVGVVLLILNE